ncbi:MAG TPA: hypothetical protein VK718_02045 [Ferruginibacter sp.]|jgi:hypothetical protein|nr:hypothetical protein [Ferruginibacter sp.]
MNNQAIPYKIQTALIKNTRWILFSGFCLFSATSFAQKDTTKKAVIDITSSYKPVLRNAVKINFSANNLNADTSKPALTYTIPSQNLFYTYQPISLKPLAMDRDTVLDLGNRNYAKLGYGNYSTPYFKAGLSFGNGKKLLVNVYGDYISSQGDIKNQNYSQASARSTISYFTPRKEIYGAIVASQNTYYLYGYDHTLYNYAASDIQQLFQNISAKIGLRNKDVTNTGISYDPNLQVDYFTNQNKLTEQTLIGNLPLEKVFNEKFAARILMTADVTSYSTVNGTPGNITFNNNIYEIAPEVIYTGSLFTLHVGLTPAWDNKESNVLPNIYGELPIKNKQFTIQAGFVGKYDKNTYQNLSAINPYLATFTAEQNTKEVELYGGIKANVGKHFIFSAKAGLVTFDNLPFFINDTATDYKSFLISNERNVQDMRIHAEGSFISEEKLTITAGFTLNNYAGFKDNTKAWGTVPFELTGSIRWQALKRLLLKTDLMAFTGGPYLLKGGVAKSLSGGADLSAGAELGITKRISLWCDVNNILNDKYQRWYNYEVYGINLVGGLLIKF